MASRRQTRITALAFVSLLALEDDSRQWLHFDTHGQENAEIELQKIIETVKDDNLKITLPFGIGMHHAGLQHYERTLVERVFFKLFK